jgi:hypothetical protein
VASKGYVQSLINRLDDKVRVSLNYVFDHVLDNGQIGPIEHGKKAINFRFYRLDATTSTAANTEFSIIHGLGVAPFHVLPLLPLTSSGVQMVRLKVTRAADASRLYLSSPDTNAAISVLVEV